MSKMSKMSKMNTLLYINNKNFPKFMMCCFSKGDPSRRDPSRNFQFNYIGYQSDEYYPIQTTEYFEVEILKVENDGNTLFIRSNDKKVSLDYYKDEYGNLSLHWDDKHGRYISTIYNPYQDIVLLPTKKVSIKSRLRNLWRRNTNTE
jgi:hypothetical protein